MLAVEVLRRLQHPLLAGVGKQLSYLHILSVSVFLFHLVALFILHIAINMYLFSGVNILCMTERIITSKLAG